MGGAKLEEERMKCTILPPVCLELRFQAGGSHSLTWRQLWMLTMCCRLNHGMHMRFQVLVALQTLHNVYPSLSRLDKLRLRRLTPCVVCIQECV
jgi:hypothetical protein